ncbi:hypothetical protein R3P38DRAFT_2807925 [Favolaschia claudopus]|uniref:Uncharacterized protein n=1 Tax=Favolaschia claudopus TaxID=2862362 RepID=A0AAV9ZII2_9AGAR
MVIPIIVTLDLYCLPTILCNGAALSSLSGKQLSATLETVRAQTTWPRDGTLFIDLNDDAGGKSWPPWELEPCLPLDITNYVRPGTNTVRFIQLEGMAHLTFI